MFFDQVSSIQRYISEIHCAWIMYMNCSIKTKESILVFVKNLKIFPEEHVLICTLPCLGETKRICNSSCSGIANLVLSSALSTQKTTEKLKI